MSAAGESESAREDDAAAILAAALVDPGLLERLATQYRGRHDVLDALYWRSHPLGTSRGGIPDPAIERDRLARAAYSREGAATQRTDLARLEARLAEDAADLDDALEALRHREPTERRTAEEPPPPRTIAQPRRTRVLASVAAGAVVVLVATVVLLGLRLASSEAVLAGAAPTAGTDPLERFDVPQTSEDLPPVSLPYDYEKSTFRRLLNPEQTDLTDYVLYGARTDHDLVCLVLVFPDENTASSCVSVSEFRQRGIRVSANVLRPSRLSLGIDVPVAHTVTWQNDDGFEFSSSLAE